MVVKLPVITEREQEMLLLVYQYKYLTLPLITRGLRYAVTSINHVGECAKGLIDKALLHRFPLPTTTRGTRSYIYTLAPAGIKVVRSMGIDDTEGWAATTTAPTYMHFAHCLATNELLIAASLLPTRLPTVTIKKALPDWQLRKYQIRVQSADGGYFTLIPDGLLDVRFKVGGKWLQSLLWLEVDRGTEQQKQLKRKIHGLYTIGSDPKHLAVLGTQTLTIAFATTEGEKRRAILESWIEQQLQSIGHTHDADLFLTTAVTPGNMDPVQVYTKPLWTVPFTKEKVPLIDLSL